MHRILEAALNLNSSKGPEMIQQAARHKSVSQPAVFVGSVLG